MYVLISVSRVHKQVFIPVLADGQATVVERMASMEILLVSLTHDPALLRTFILKQ